MPLPDDGLLTLTPQGLYCHAAQAWIDPWRPVPRALITHAHADHARAGCGEYWAIASSEGILRQRLGQDIRLLPVDYGQVLAIGDARVVARRDERRGDVVSGVESQCHRQPGVADLAKLMGRGFTELIPILSRNTGEIEADHGRFGLEAGNREQGGIG